ncbi:Hypothetical_protein [Hexamita inflata]|uniref:Hypothetical_protein n=1 Tax=Hexamita inflata TaxID=28002 RepID=A0AA86QFP6_9EUKA|nr:Hypothetical protein HINF_LOCUS45500 [Hexamita inflata]
MTYFNYSECYYGCYNGYCNSTTAYDYNTYKWRDAYECVEYDTHNYGSYALLLLLIPIAFIFILTLACCCHKKKQQQRMVLRQAQGQRAQVVPTQAQTPQTQVNQNVTGVAPQGQLVTLPNGQVGIFIPLTQPQQTQVRQVQAQQQQQDPQFYQPQPIYQQQIYQPPRVVVQQVQQQAPQQVQQTIPTYSNFQQQQAPQRAVEYVQMPIMPAMPQ